MDQVVPRLWTETDVGQWLNMPSARVVRLARKGLIPSIQLPDGELVFDPQELAAWIERCRREGGEHGR